MMDKLEKLAGANINLLPTVEITSHFVLERDGFVALVERQQGDVFGKVGAAGLLIDGGIALLMRKGDGHVFRSKGVELDATPEKIQALRSFQADLTKALQ